jgi:hypothetical protein
MSESELELELNALRWVVTRMAAEVILLNQNPAQKMNDLKAECDALGVESVRNFDKPNGEKLFRTCTNIGIIMDEIAEQLEFDQT